MIKSSLINELIKYFENEYASLKEIAESAQKSANHDEMKKEDKHDTRSTEAKYLALAQAARASEMERDLNILKNFSYQDSKVIAIGSLVLLKEADKIKSIFISPSLGGITLQGVQILSFASPVAQALIGTVEGDLVEFEINSKFKEYLIQKIS